MPNAWKFDYSTNYVYFIDRTDFRVLYPSETNVKIWLKVNGADTEIPAESHGNYSTKNIDVKTTYEKFVFCDYLNIKYLVTNTGSSTSTIGLATYFWMGIDGDSNSGVKYLPDKKGLEIFYNGKTVNLLLRNSHKVTNVSTLIYRGGTSGSPSCTPDFPNVVWDDLEMTREKPDGDCFSKVSFTWQNVALKEGESKEFSFSIGVGDYINPHEIEITSSFEDFYIPGSSLLASILVSHTVSGSSVTVTRSINGTNSTEIAKYDDDGLNKEIQDDFSLPSLPGYYEVIYRVSDNVGESASRVVVKVTERPEIKLSKPVSSQFHKSDEVSVNVDVYDDTFCDVIVNEYEDNNDENHYQEVTRLRVECNGKHNISTLTFTLPDASYGTVKKYFVTCIDEFSITSSSNITFNITIVEHIQPELKLSKKPSIFFAKYETLKLKGYIRAEDSVGDVCLFTKINDTDQKHQGCKDLSDKLWHDFSCSLSLSNYSENFYVLSLFGLDSTPQRSNVIYHIFVVVDSFSDKFSYHKQCYTEYATTLLFMIPVSMEES